MISIKFEGVNGFFNCMALAPRQIGIATQRAMLNTAQKINDAKTEEMKRVFNHPTRWVLGSMRITGVYQRFFFSIGNAIKPIMIFISDTRYKLLFNFGRVVQQTYDHVWPVEAAAVIQREIEKL